MYVVFKLNRANDDIIDISVKRYNEIEDFIDLNVHKDTEWKQNFRYSEYINNLKQNHYIIIEDNINNTNTAFLILDIKNREKLKETNYYTDIKYFLNKYDNWLFKEKIKQIRNLK